MCFEQNFYPPLKLSSDKVILTKLRSDWNATREKSLPVFAMSLCVIFPVMSTLRFMSGGSSPLLLIC
jgi:hypothetical protein